MTEFPTIISGNPQILTETNELSFRVQPSTIAGVGVFTTHGIAKGTFLQIRDPLTEIRFITKAEAANNPTMLAFSQWYGIPTVQDNEHGYWLPAKFNQMAIYWYLNYSHSPNIYRDKNFQFYTNRDIQMGEELVVDFRTL